MPETLTHPLITTNQKGIIQSSCRYFITTIFNYVIEPHHENILSHAETSTQSLDLAPRGSGKSRIITIGYVAWRALIDPNIRILIVSDTDDHAVRFLSTIKSALHYHPLIKQHFGNLAGNKWTDHQIEVAGRTKILTEATITAQGAYSGAVTSGHYDIIICDDLVNFENSRTEGSRVRMLEWFKQTLLPTLIPGGELHIIGTRYHFLDLYQVMIDELKYDCQIQQAIIRDIDGNELSIWEEYMPLSDRVDPANGKLTQGLRTIQGNLGSVIFNLQYQNDAELMKKGNIFEYDWFRWYETETREDGKTYLLRPDGQAVCTDRLTIYAGVDPSIGEGDQSDFFAVCVIGLDRLNKDYYVLDIHKARLSYEGRSRIIDTKYQMWHPQITGIEDVAFQKEFCQRIRKTYPYIRIKEIKTTKDKVSRAYGRSGLVQNGKVFVKKGMADFVEELCIMPEGAHDDQFDAFDFAIYVSESADGGNKLTPIPGAGKYRGDGTHEDKRTWQTKYK
jgi:predicted phage terminase large subunit-like protein